jgi:hypothetical protein
VRICVILDRSVSRRQEDDLICLGGLGRASTVFCVVPLLVYLFLDQSLLSRPRYICPHTGYELSGDLLDKS